MKLSISFGFSSLGRILHRPDAKADANRVLTQHGGSAWERVAVRMSRMIRGKGRRSRRSATLRGEVGRPDGRSAFNARGYNGKAATSRRTPKGGRLGEPSLPTTSGMGQ
jgi:hypothetical protein